MTEHQGLPEDVRAALAAWAEGNDLLLMVHFGSGARKGGAEFRGDVDLAIWFDTFPPAARRLAIIGELQDVVEPRDVDVAFLHLDTDPVFRFEIFRTGELVYEAEEGVFVHEAVRALALYEDALPFRTALEKSVRTGGLGP